MMFILLVCLCAAEASVANRSVSVSLRGGRIVLFSRNSEGQFQIFSAAGVVPTRELWPYESILDFVQPGNHIRTWAAPPLCPYLMW